MEEYISRPMPGLSMSEGRQWLGGKVMAQKSGNMDRVQLHHQLEALVGRKQPLLPSLLWTGLVPSHDGQGCQSGNSPHPMCVEKMLVAGNGAESGIHHMLGGCISFLLLL